MRCFAISLYLLALMLYALAGTPLAPFHGDESTLIYGSRDYFDQFVARDMQRVMNLRDDDPMDHNLRLLDGRVQTYLGGFAYHLTGGTADGLNQPWLWGAPAQFNLDDGHVPDDRLLMAQRWAMALLLALSIPAAYGVGTQMGGMWGGLVMATLVAVSPNLALNGRRVMMEAPLLLFSLLTTLAALRIAASSQPTANSGRRTAVYLLLLGLGAGMALGSKHSALFTVAPLFGALGLWMLWRRCWRGVAGLMVAGVIATAVYLALNPAWWANPVDTGREMLALRTELLASQTANLGGYADFGGALRGFVEYAVLETPQYFEVAGWEEVGTTIAAYEASPWVLSPLMNAVRAAVTSVCAALGIAALIRRRDGVAWVAGIWIIGAVGSALLLTPLPWARYYLTALPAIYALAAAGLGHLVTLRRTP
ncbi:MAG: phospholipid carrier-dependent glycosyltransferase [Chloroflexi bacterium]|nr:phospholipid carrier-dependent glycosyltransferase [Chloroflexota bacterium]